MSSRGLLSALPTPKDRLLVRFLAETGLRISELKAVRWRDLELDEEPLVSVRRRHRLLDGEQETKSERSSGTVPITLQLARELKAHRLRNGQPGPGELVFTGPQRQAAGRSELPKARARRRLCEGRARSNRFPRAPAHTWLDRRRCDPRCPSGTASTPARLGIVHARDVHPPPGRPGGGRCRRRRAERSPPTQVKALRDQPEASPADDASTGALEVPRSARSSGDPWRCCGPKEPSFSPFR